MDIEKYEVIPLRDSADAFMELFNGRTDVHGSEEGGCVREPVTRNLVHAHFQGRTPIGIYPMVNTGNDWMVGWGCSDIDINDYRLAEDLRDAFAAANVYAHIEQSRSKGYHVWVFAETWVPARHMRRMFLACHQVADIPAREVNPKQETLAENQFGNYVRLPYANYMNDPTSCHRKILIDKNTPMQMHDFIRVANAHLTDRATIERLAGFYKAPVATIKFNADYEECTHLGEAMKLLSPLGKVIWRDGPLAGRDRSSTLAKLGHECVRSGLNPSQTRVVVDDADRRWGKYHERANGSLEIDKLVERVFRTT